MLTSGARKSFKFALKVKLSVNGKKLLKLMKSHSGKKSQTRSKLTIETLEQGVKYVQS